MIFYEGVKLKDSFQSPKISANKIDEWAKYTIGIQEVQFSASRMIVTWQINLVAWLWPGCLAMRFIGGT